MTLNPKISLWLALVLSGGSLLIFTGCQGIGTRSSAALPKTEASASYEVVTNAFNRADWVALHRLTKPGMKANESVELWESYEHAGHPVRVGKLLSVEKNSQYYLDGKPCTTYSFELESKDGTPGVYWLQVVVREEGGKSTILDFWNFGW